MNKSIKIGFQLVGLAVWATVWIGGGLWLAHLGTKPEKISENSGE